MQLFENKNMASKLILKLETQKPSESVQRKALEELRETAHNKETGLNELKRLLQAEPDLVAPLDNEEWLLLFLRICKFYPESARDAIKRFYRIRYNYPEVKTALVPSKLKHVFDAQLMSILPQRDQHGRRIIVTVSGIKWNYKSVSQNDLFSSSILCTDFLQKEPETQINGVVYILDLEGFSLAHVLQYTTYNLKRFLIFIQDAPLRVKGFHIVNQPKIFQPLFAICKNFMNTKFAKRIIMHGTNYESLHQHISPECLPKCYGGKLDIKLMYSDETYEIMTPHEGFFEHLQNFGYKK